ncbi:RNA polymerase sigma factor SigJ [Cellulomonas fimi]|uniref:RNA polymerase sigma factor SigJ n=1 Tax=Cellulomonas fimi TaxID=1708 RepID=A0A7Y0M065_CELFI|nr:RNA polymerase sigma factor SigJ [Cellulomonas fimi]NMR19987.1 RNA polymerase sigma factor SigJ [Cellulomonas fimi]
MRIDEHVEGGAVTQRADRSSAARGAAAGEARGEAFESHRARLVGVAYRMLGSLAEAEDVVQDAWLRLARADDAGDAGDAGTMASSDVAPRDLGAWLTTVVGRLALDRLRSACARREVYVGPWLPEPLVRSPTLEPAAQVELDDTVRLALLVVLERLTPEQRVAFVLHDVLGLPFADVAEVLGTTAAAARQHASRARRAVQDAGPARPVPAARQQAAVAAFAAATAGGDLGALVRVLAPDVVLVSDGGGRVRAALRPVVGAENVARLLLGLAAQAGEPGAGLLAVPALVNDELGFVVRLERADGSVDLSVVVPHVDDAGRVGAVDMIRNPDKLGAVRAWADEALAAQEALAPDGSSQTVESVNP